MSTGQDPAIAPSQRRPRPKPGLAFRLALALTSFLLTCLALEAGLRLCHPVGLHPTDTFLQVGPTPEDPEAGKVALVANTVARHRTEEFDFAVRINARGLRDRDMPYRKPPGVYRILVLGDSHTFGWGVDLEQTYAKRLEQELEPAAKAAGFQRVEALNAGVPGTGTAHQLYFLETEGWKYRPDAVVLGFFFNDVNDNELSPLYALENGHLVRRDPVVRRGFPFPTGVAGGRENGSVEARKSGRTGEAPASRPAPPLWIRHSHLVRFVRECLARAWPRQREHPIPGRRLPYARELTAHLLAEMARQCEEHQAALVVALIPAPADCGSHPTPSLREGHARLLRHLPKPDRLLIDLMPAFRTAGCQVLFFPRDGHINAAGHRLAAAAISRHLAARWSRRRAHPPP